jgi:hypothetical protein
MSCFMGHGLMENRSGLIVQAELTQADGHAGRRAAIDRLHRHSPGSPGTPPSMPQPPGTRAAPNRSGAGRGSRKPLAGPGRSEAWHRPCIAASSLCVPASPRRWRPAIGRGCRNRSAPEPGTARPDRTRGAKASTGRPSQKKAILSLTSFTSLLSPEQ